MFVLLMNGCLCFLGFSFLSISRVIGWEECVQNELLYVEWDVKTSNE